MTTPDPADVHTGTDRVELTDAERERIIEAIYQGRVHACRETVENWGPPEDEADTHSLLLRVLRGESEGFVANALPVVESICAARLQALTAERDELQAILDGRPKNISEFIHLLDQSVVLPPATIDAARAEAERHRLAREDYWEQLTAARAELAAANTELDRLAALKGRVDELAEYAERAQVAEATLDLVTALADDLDVFYPQRFKPTPSENYVLGWRDLQRKLRAALTPEGTE